MAKKEKESGFCRICGCYGPLTDEHVPPRAAYNKGRVYVGSGADNVTRAPGDYNFSKLHQGGYKVQTLCKQCNEKTGHWYVNKYSDWVTQGFESLIREPNKVAHREFFNVYPLEISKQIITMFFSVNGALFRQRHPDLVKFVLDPLHQGIPRNYFLYMHMSTSSTGRLIGVTSLKYGSQVFAISELTTVPFGYILSFDRPLAIPGLADISHFASVFSPNRGYDIQLRISTLPVETHFPLDFRTTSQSQREMEESRLSGKPPKPTRDEVTAERELILDAMALGERHGLDSRRVTAVTGKMHEDFFDQGSKTD